MSDVEVVNLWGETMVQSWHGTENGYGHYGCRCELCRKAHNDYQNARKIRLTKKITGNEPWHGTRTGYSYHGCRCKPCGAAYSLSERARRYGVSEKRLSLLLSKTVCKICGTKNPGLASWHIDHDHKCCPGKKSCGNCVRELICGSCNKMLGLAKDDPEILKSAIAYIELHAA
jgi:hypothetical protein